MLKSISLKRFKSICNDEPIPLDMFSILCGSNSSGKSSLIQSILFLSQSLSSRFDKTSFVLNGSFVKLGAIRDIRSHFSKQENVEIKLAFTGSKYRWAISETDIIEIRFLLGKRNGFNGSLEDELHPVVVEADVTVRSFRSGEEDVQTLSVVDAYFNEIPNAIATDKGTLFSIKDLKSSEIKSLEKEFPGMKIKGCARDGFLPKTIIFDYDLTLRISNSIISIICGTGPHHGSLLGSYHYREIEEDRLRIPVVFFEVLRDKISEELATLRSNFQLPEALKKALKSNHLLQRSIDYEEIKKQIISRQFQLTPEIFDAPIFSSELPLKNFKQFISELDKDVSNSLIEFMSKHQDSLREAWYEGTYKETGTEIITLRLLDAVEDFLVAYFSRSVKYLGPLRNEPQANYPTNGFADPKNVGLKGENTAAVLHVNRNRNIVYLSPREELDGYLSLDSSATSLERACKVWLSYLGVAHDFLTVDTGKMGHLLRVKTNHSDEWQDLTHVGVGVSQVLPIVLMALLADPGDLLIFEQPELHLHPRVQSRLCDFFIAIALSGRQCLIETHSEYLITRLRARIAQSEHEEIKNLSSIYFIDKIDGASQFTKVDISRFGAIENWPKDFFDDNNKEIEMIIREAAKKRKKERTALNKTIKISED